MRCVAEEVVNVARLLLLLVLALALGGFSYTLGYETAEQRTHESMGRKMEAIQRSLQFGSPGEDEDADEAAGGAVPQDGDVDPARRVECRPECDEVRPTGSTRDGNRAGGKRSPAPGS